MREWATPCPGVHRDRCESGQAAAICVVVGARWAKPWYAAAVDLARLERRLAQTASVRPEGVAVAAVAAVLRPGPEPELLFIRRAEHPADPWSGHMAFPGGRQNLGDSSPLGAAVRETKEELGLDLEADARWLGALPPVPASARGRRIPLVIHPFVFSLAGPRPTLVPDPGEVAEALWIPLPVLEAPERRETLVQIYEGEPVPLPCCRYEGRAIWGLTLHMLDTLLAASR